MARTGIQAQSNRANVEVSDREKWAEYPGEDREVISDIYTELSLDVIFEILKNKQRRESLHHLNDTDEDVVSLDELAKTIAATENDISVAQVSSQQRKRVYIALYQCHLPKMADVGIIDYNKPRGTVELKAAGDQVYKYLELSPRSHSSDQHESSRSSAINGWIGDRL